MMRETKIVIPFEPAPESDVPIVKFYLDDKPRYAIVDTGAESTLFDVSLKKALKIIHSEEISIVGVSGETQQEKIEKTKTRLWMTNQNGHTLIIKASGYIHDLSHISSHFLGDECDKRISAIFGSDMLNTYNSKIDFINHEIHFEI